MQRINLYPYQEEAVQNAVTMLTERGNSLIVAGTGAGKTIMMAAAIGRFFNGFYAMNKRKPHVLVLVHRTEIHGQNHAKFSGVCPEIATSEITASRKSLHGYVHFGMVQTVANLLSEFQEAGSFFDLVVIDEAHHAKASTYEEIIAWNRNGNPNSALLGVTATPNRGDKLPLVHLFDNYNQITTKFLIDSHYLVRPRFVDCSPTFLLADGAQEKGHLAKNCLLDADGFGFVQTLCEVYLEEKEPGKSIIFAPNHGFCLAIQQALQKMGRNPAYLALGLDDIARKEELERFETGDCEELINVDICTEGYDFPVLRNVVEFDSNGTHGQWVQKVGRVLRTAPGKTTCTVIDFGGNVDLYPQGVETDVDLDGVFKKPKGNKLTEEDFFRERKEKQSAAYVTEDAARYTPYHTPPGFETVSDKDFGIVFVACGKARDCIIICHKDGYALFLGDKQSMVRNMEGTFHDCVSAGTEHVGCLSELREDKREIGRLQIRLLAPEYPTTALTWYGANCCICWKTWRDSVSKQFLDVICT